MQFLGSFKQNSRGQTTIDFAIGVSIFLLTVAFVFSFMPTLFDPLLTPIDPSGNIASQSAATLVADKFISANGASDKGVTLDRGCAVEFFEGDDNDIYDDPTNCKNPVSDNSSASFESEMGLDDNTQNVYIEMTEIETGETITDGETTFARGEEIGEGQATESSTSRFVHLDGETYRLEIVVW